MDGALLLELYSRDGVGTMLSADFYEVGNIGMTACSLIGIIVSHSSERMGRLGSAGSTLHKVQLVPAVAVWA